MIGKQEELRQAGRWTMQTYKVMVKATESFILEVEAENEDDAYLQASAAMIDVEPEMEIISWPDNSGRQANHEPV